MKLRRLSSLLASTALATAVSVPVAASASAQPADAPATPSGTRSLAAVLTSDGNRFDNNWRDYDIVTEAVLAVLAAKPNSPVGVLADGSKALTAFVPDDRAFQSLLHDLAGRRVDSEHEVFDALASSVGVDRLEKVLLYHVVPGATIDSGTALKSDGARLATALTGAGVVVHVVDDDEKVIRLRDNDPDDRNARITAFDLNKGNRQIAHGITQVLRPADL